MSVSEIAAELLKLATERRALTFGDYVLSSGQHSSYYFDGRRLTLDPRGCVPDRQGLLWDAAGF